jgi:hypothetical protein
MIVESEFNIGDTVYIIEGYSIVDYKISKIYIEVDNTGIYVKYGIYGINKPIPQYGVSKSKEGLIKKLLT